MGLAVRGVAAADRHVEEVVHPEVAQLLRDARALAARHEALGEARLAEARERFSRPGQEGVAFPRVEPEPAGVGFVPALLGQARPPRRCGASSASRCAEVVAVEGDAEVAEEADVGAEARLRRVHEGAVPVEEHRAEALGRRRAVTGGRPPTTLEASTASTKAEMKPKSQVALLEEAQGHDHHPRHGGEHQEHDARLRRGRLVRATRPESSRARRCPRPAVSTASTLVSSGRAGARSQGLPGHLRAHQRAGPRP